ncbi:hypothetical protein BASA81_011445 [Batrachochytrium salamandrivorans]|nr:hypothetical protein BASA81_011445 [Batrachochytrium salamandrivorans]
MVHLSAECFGSSKGFHNNIRCLQWCPKKDVVAFLDIHGELQVLRIWELVRKWSPKETSNADMVVWSPEGTSLTAINSATGLVSTFEVEARVSHTLHLELRPEEKIVSCRWDADPSQKISASRTNVRLLLNATPRTDSHPALLSHNQPISLLTITTNFARAIAVLNGCFIISDTTINIYEYYHNSKVAEVCGIFSWIDYDFGRSLTIHSIVKEYNTDKLQLASSAFYNAASIYPDLGNISVLIDQLQRLISTMRNHVEMFEKNLDTFQGAQQEASTEISSALRVHGSGLSPAEFLKKLLLGWSNIDILSQLASDSPKKRLKRALNGATLSSSSAALHFVTGKAAGEDAIYILGELHGITLRSAWRQRMSQSDDIRVISDSLVASLGQISLLKRKLDKESAEFTSFLKWVFAATDENSGGEYQAPSEMHSIIARLLCKSTIFKSSSQLGTNNSPQIQTIRQSVDMLSQKLTNMELLRLHPDNLYTTTISQHDKLEVLATSPDYCLARAMNIYTCTADVDDQDSHQYGVGYIQISDIPLNGQVNSNEDTIAKVQLMPLYSCEAGICPTAMQISSTSNLFKSVF